MANTNVLDAIKTQEVKDIFKEYGVSEVFLFGSFARGDENTKSDVDLLVQYREDSKVLGFFDFLKFRKKIEKKIKRKVDIVNKEFLSANLEYYIKGNLIKLF